MKIKLLIIFLFVSVFARAQTKAGFDRLKLDTTDFKAVTFGGDPNYVGLKTAGVVSDPLKLNISDTAAMLSHYAELFELALKLSLSDTAFMLSHYAELAELAVKLNISDTAGMLNHYAELAELALKLNIADTSAMLGPYITEFEADQKYLQTVAVDGTTVTGDGTVGNPLVATSTGGGENLDQTLTIGNTTGTNNIVMSNNTFIQDATGQYQIDIANGSGINITQDAGTFVKPGIVLDNNTAALKGNANSEVGSFGVSGIVHVKSTAEVDINAPLINVPQFAGVGNRMVISNSSGDLSTTAIPSGTVTAVTGTSPIHSSGGTTPDITIDLAAADDASIGAAGFKQSDFNDDGLGFISIDYANGQKASAINDGFLSAANWSDFNDKQDLITWQDVTAASNKISLGGTPAGSVNSAFSVDVAESNLTLNNIGGTLGISKGGTNLTSLGSASQLIRVNAGATALEYFTPSFLTSETDPLSLKILNNLSDLNNAGTALTNIGGTTVGKNVFTATNPSAIRWIRVNADNTITFRTAAETLGDIGAQASGSYLTVANNLSDVNSASTSRNNLGATTIGSNYFTLTNPGAITFIRQNADNSLTSRSAANFKADLSLDNVENTALSTWAGSTNITTLGTIGTGTWNATAIGATKGGTGFTTTTKGDVIYSDATNSWAKLAHGASLNKVLHSGDGTTAPSWSLVSLTADVTGTLPYGNGGTGATSFTNHGVVTAGASALTTVAPGSNGNVLTSNGTDWVSSAAAGGSMAIGSAVTSGTAGSVLFVGTGGLLQQNNTKFFFDSTNVRLGINQGTPTSAFHLNKNQNSVTQNDANGILLANSTAATLGLQSISPPIVLQGNAWMTASSTSGDIRFKMDMLPVQGGGVPNGTWQLSSNQNAAGYNTILTVSQAGGLTASSFITSNSTLTGVNLIATGTAAITSHLNCGSNTSNLWVGSQTGVTSSSAAGYLPTGSTDMRLRVGIRGVSSTITANASSCAFIIGDNPITEAGSGTHPLLAQQIIKQITITNGSATTTDATSLYIEGAPIGITPTNPATALWIAAGNARFGGTLSAYNNVTTAGWGVPAIYGMGRATAQTAANASVSTYTVGASDGSFLVSANVLVTTSSAENFTVTVSYTDEGNTARTLTLNFQTIAGVVGTAIAFANGAVPYEGVAVHLRCKASTAITIKTAAGGTYTGCTYNVEGMITQIN